MGNCQRVGYQFRNWFSDIFWPSINCNLIVNPCKPQKSFDHFSKCNRIFWNSDGIYNLGCSWKIHSLYWSISRCVIACCASSFWFNVGLNLRAVGSYQHRNRRSTSGKCLHRWRYRKSYPTNNLGVNSSAICRSRYFLPPSHICN